METFTGPELERQFAHNIESLVRDAIRLLRSYEALPIADAETVLKADPGGLLSGTFVKGVRRWSHRTWDRLLGPRTKEWGPRRFTRGACEERPKLHPLPEWLGTPMRDFVMALRGVHIDLLDLEDAWSGLDAGARRAAGSAYPFTETVEDLLKTSAAFHARLLAALWPRSG